MTNKAALAELPLGGGKAVILGDPATRTRTRDQLLAVGDFIDSLGGEYITAEDMGTSPDDMAVIAERTSHVVGLPTENGGSGGPSPYTSQGVFMAIEAALPASVDSVATDAILSVDCDLFAPCGPPAVIDQAVARNLSCSIVCGAANNPLSDPSVATTLAERGLLYVPDFLANAGGIIHLAAAMHGGTVEDTRTGLEIIPRNFPVHHRHRRRTA